jgi:hydroxyacylglutathione hydrolase
MTIPLEDTFTDVINKAKRGLGLAEIEGLSVAELATKLHLKASALDTLQKNAWTPPPVEIPGLLCFNSPFHDMTVNNYLVYDPVSKNAAAFDTGTDVQPLLQNLSKLSLKLTAIFLSHTHGDHILELDLLKEKTGAPAYVGDLEPLAGAETFAAGREFHIGSLRVETRLTCGHSLGGITYVVHGLSQPIAIVGDALFASSMGGGKVSYADALRTNRTQIFTLPNETVICPGHGPLTTVGLEKIHNPFFPEFA